METLADLFNLSGVEHHLPYGHCEEVGIQPGHDRRQSLCDDIRLLDVLLLLFGE